MKNEIMIRPLSKDDVPQTTELIAKVFSGQSYFATKSTADTWDWRYNRSVFGKSIQFVAENKEKEIIGFRSFWPWQFLCRGQVLSAFQPQATVVHPSYRNCGIFKEMNRFAVEEAVNRKTDFVFNFPNKQSLQGYISMGWSFISKISWGVKPLLPLTLMKSCFVKDKASPVEISSEFILSSRNFEYLKDPVSYDGFLRTNTSPAFFEWRYVNNPFFQYGFHMTTIGNKWMSGVFSIVQKGPRKEMYVVDLFGHSKCLFVFFRELTQIAKLMGVAFIAVIKNRFFSMNTLWKNGFITVRKKNLVALPLNFAIERKVSMIHNWKLTGGMHDSI